MKKRNKGQFSRLLKYAILAIFSIVLLSGIEEIYAEYGIYYGTDDAYAKSLFDQNLIIIQDYNFSLFNGYTGKKICYLSIGESTETLEELKSLRGEKAIIGKNAEWKSFIMDMGNPVWKEHVLEKVDTLKALGCDGLFLDTLWQENQESRAIQLIKSIRKRWLDSYIIVNNAHLIKDAIRTKVDAFMFEDFGIFDNTSRAWNLKLMREYKKLDTKYKKDLFAISYLNPHDPHMKAEYQMVVKLGKIYGFKLVIVDRNIIKLFEI